MNLRPIASVFIPAALSVAAAGPAHAYGAPWVNTAASVTENLSGQGGTRFSRACVPNKSIWPC